MMIMIGDNRDLKQGQRRRERERQNTIGIMNKNNGPARPARSPQNNGVKWPNLMFRGGREHK